MSPADRAGLVTVHVWQVAPGSVPRACWRMAVDRTALPRIPGVRFGKMLGTGRGRAMGLTSADLTRWAALAAWDEPAAADWTAATDPAAAFDDSAVGRAWARLAVRSCRLTLRPVSSRGSWAGREPFGTATAAHPDGDGPVAVLTRAQLRPSRAIRFWQAIDPVAAAMAGAPGLLAAFGAGEAPLGFQGTLSVWRGAADVVRFAYRQPEHMAVVARTPVERWYSEELFARFTVLDVSGDPGVIGWTAGT